MEVVADNAPQRPKLAPAPEPSSLISHPVFDLPHWQAGNNSSATSELEARVARLERTLSATLDLIYRLIHAGQDRPKPQPRDVQESK